jgi:ketosteroid isomerase-like protein
MRSHIAAMIAVVTLLGLGAASCAARATSRILDNNPADASAIRAMEDEFRQAKVKNDTAALARIVAADYYGVNQNGNARNREQLVDLFKTFPVRSLEVDIERLRISGDNAVTAGRQREDCQGPDCAEIHVFLRTWIRRDNRWQLLSNAHYRDPNKGGPARNTYSNDSW